MTSHRAGWHPVGARASETVPGSSRVRLPGLGSAILCQVRDQPLRNWWDMKGRTSKEGTGLSRAELGPSTTSPVSSTGRAADFYSEGSWFKSKAGDSCERNGLPGQPKDHRCPAIDGHDPFDGVGVARNTITFPIGVTGNTSHSECEESTFESWVGSERSGALGGLTRQSRPRGRRGFKSRPLRGGKC